MSVSKFSYGARTSDESDAGRSARMMLQKVSPFDDDDLIRKKKFLNALRLLTPKDQRFAKAVFIRHLTLGQLERRFHIEEHAVYDRLQQVIDALRQLHAL